MESTLCPDADTRLIETFGWLPQHGARALGLHLDRMARSSAALGFAFDRGAAEQLVAAIHAEAPQRCRLTLGASGDLELTRADLPPSPPEWRAIIAPDLLDPADPWLRHKTTRRALYDRHRAALPEGVGEAVFFNTDGHLCEGTITNLFVTLADGRRATPALSCGLLPGIYRQQQLALGAVTEALITRQDLANARAITAGNSLRAEIPLRLTLQTG